MKIKKNLITYKEFEIVIKEYQFTPYTHMYKFEIDFNGDIYSGKAYTYEAVQELAIRKAKWLSWVASRIDRFAWDMFHD